MPVVTVLLAIGVLALTALALHQQTQLSHLEDAVVLPDSLEGQSAAHDAIVVTIRNHAEVAADRNPLAPTLSLLSPALVRTIVHRQAVSELRAQLAEEGIDADVRVRRVVPRGQGG